MRASRATLLNCSLRLRLADLVGVVVADNALVLGEAQLAALVCGQSEGRQENRFQSMDRSAVICNCREHNESLSYSHFY